MDKDLLKGIKQGSGFLLVLLVAISVYAVGFHQTNEIVPGIFQGNYSFNGSVEFKETLSINGTGTVCDLKGKVRYSDTSKGLELCNGTDWNPIDYNKKIFSSCMDAYQEGRDKDGRYVIDPDGNNSGVSSFQVYCVMNEDGGGWIKMSVSYPNNIVCKGNAYKFDGEDAWSYLSEPEMIESRTGGSYNTWETFNLNYINPATGKNYSTTQISAIRDIITELSDNTRMQIQDSDSDIDSGCGGSTGCGYNYYHRVRLVAEDGSKMESQEKTTCYSNGGGGSDPSYGVTYLTESSKSYLGHSGTSCWSTPSSLTPKFIIPDKLERWLGSGGGSCWGYEKPYFLVR